ncbi:MAG: pilus assembly protein PilM [Candidatus Omnitrophica bacterium]|nr:pilus assembly protein PilM [Candidatus Omnitrophota bacterium]
MRVFPHIGIKDIICVSLSTDNLKLAYAKISPTRKELVDLVSYEIQGLSDDEITKSIQSSLDSLKLYEPEVIVTVPSHATIAKNIEIPSLDAREIREIVDLQAGRHTPYSREEIVIDYINIGAYRENYTKILLIIVTLSVIRRQIDILERAGLRVEKVYFTPEVVTRLSSSVLKITQSPTVQTFIHIDAHFTDFINICKGEVIFVRSIPIGKQHLTSEQDRYQMRFIDEVKKSLETYQSEDIGAMPEEIILTGSIREGSGLQDLIGKMLYVPVKFFSYLDHAPMSSEELKKSLSVGQDSFLDVIAPLIGPAGTHINLIPEEIKLRKKFEEKSKDLVTAGVYILTILAMLCLMLISKIYFKASYLKNLNETYDSVIQASKRLEKNFSQIRLIKRELKDRHIAMEVLAELYNLIPTDIQLNGIKFSLQGRFSIEGNSRTMGTVFSFIGDMEESEFFKNVESKRTTKRKEDGEEIVDFEIICTFENVLGKTG